MLLNLLLFCGLGAVIRYLLSKWNDATWFPWGTFAANILGAFLIGFFYHRIENKELYAILATGFCGGLTTFSTLNAEFLDLLKDKKKLVLYAGLTYGLGFLAIFLGIHL